MNRIALQNLVRRTYDAASMQELARLLEGSVNKLAEGGTVTLGTEVASTSGTSIDFIGIPSWVTQIVISLVGLSVSGTSNPMVQIGDAGGIETTNYLGSASNHANGPAVAAANFTTGFGLAGATLATSVFHGAITLTLENAATNTWTSSGSTGFSDAAGTTVFGGSKSLSGTLDRFRITTVGGANTFDAGAINFRAT